MCKKKSVKKKKRKRKKRFSCLRHEMCSGFGLDRIRLYSENPCYLCVIYCTVYWNYSYFFHRKWRSIWHCNFAVYLFFVTSNMASCSCLCSLDIFSRRPASRTYKVKKIILHSLNWSKHERIHLQGPMTSLVAHYCRPTHRRKGQTNLKSNPKFLLATLSRCKKDSSLDISAT